MRFYVMTLFPELVEAVTSSSIFGRAVENGIIRVEAVNIRDFSTDKHKHVDDYPYGGGKGMLMKAEPVYRCWASVMERAGQGARVLYMDPAGTPLTQDMARAFAKEESLVFLCGHYEGIDERVLETVVTDRVSIGDYVLTGGELPACVVMDAVARQVPGVLSEGSAEEESFSDGLLEYPQYTRPETFMGMKVPQVLLSGDHGKVDAWRREQSIRRTYLNRPDLLDSAVLSKKEKKYLDKLKKEIGHDPETEKDEGFPEEDPVRPAEEGGCPCAGGGEGHPDGY
ncbi:MAG: tRNA (guanosine(37)-N1)-methyltransferase TrmD [Lachnospiraceae bacterium]|nr:tRNA (guanosine(37)-N1)-methyltransferase TrmD [Lachnospiraceae bacterium]MBP5255334.1 tRNA (guanosine(37)-N1)-methyltransferase TrmD [Lachnospiraceae bacterium]